jgi:hypothetical protein
MCVEFINVDTQEIMDQFLWLVDRFHDALLREVGITSRGYVEPGGAMWGDVAPSDARLVIHSQFVDETPYIEIIFEDLQAFRWKANHGIDQAEGVVTNTEVALYYEDTSQFMISAKKMKYRILGPEYLGKELRTVKLIIESEYGPRKDEY